MHLGEDLVQAVYDDWQTAPVREELRAALGMIRKITLEPEQFTSNDIEVVRQAGVTDDAIVNALHVCAMFNIIDRIADSVAFHIPSVESFAASANQLRRFGYALPPPFRVLMRRG